jgi:hypothetical protein
MSNTLEPQQTATVAWTAPDGTLIYGWRVRDTDGGIWYPSEEALEDIAAAGGVLAQQDRALVICRDEPMRGEWAS